VVASVFGDWFSGGFYGVERGLHVVHFRIRLFCERGRKSASTTCAGFCPVACKNRSARLCG
jgi:hypothetical protein